jgi:hypothetical protein
LDPSQAVTEPKDLEAPRGDERKTVDLCAEENRGVRCIRERGHAGQPECHGGAATSPRTGRNAPQTRDESVHARRDTKALAAQRLPVHADREARGGRLAQTLMPRHRTRRCVTYPTVVEHLMISTLDVSGRAEVSSACGETPEWNAKALPRLPA